MSDMHPDDEALSAHLGMSLTAMLPVFPGFVPKATSFPGLYA